MSKHGQEYLEKRELKALIATVTESVARAMEVAYQQGRKDADRDNELDLKR